MWMRVAGIPAAPTAPAEFMFNTLAVIVDVAPTLFAMPAPLNALNVTWLLAPVPLIGCAKVIDDAALPLEERLTRFPERIPFTRMLPEEFSAIVGIVLNPEGVTVMA